MKKVLFVIAMATLAVLFCACNKENAPATGSKSVTISASMPDDEITTKTDLNGTKLTWNNSDAIYLSGDFNAETWAGQQCGIAPYSISIDGKTADFISFFDNTWEPVDVVVGYYGRKANKIDYKDGGWYAAYDKEFDGFYNPKAYFSGLLYTNPCVQEYYNGNGPNGDYLAMADMYAKDFVNGKKLKIQFENLMSIYKIDVTSTKSRTLSSIKVTCDRGPISGYVILWKHYLGRLHYAIDQPTHFEFYENDWEHTPIAEDFSEGTYGNWIRLSSIGVQLDFKHDPFYLVVFPGYHGTLTFTLTDTDGESKVVTWNTPFTAKAGMIYNFPTIIWD